jgi:uncharacterized protein YuzE
MVFQYYPDDDMLYIEFTDGTSIESEEVAPGIVLDFDERGRIVGMEIEDAGRQVDLSKLELNSMPVATLIFTKRREAEGVQTRRVNKEMSV